MLLAKRSPAFGQTLPTFSRKVQKVFTKNLFCYNEEFPYSSREDSKHLRILSLLFMKNLGRCFDEFIATLLQPDNCCIQNTVSELRKYKLFALRQYHHLFDAPN